MDTVRTRLIILSLFLVSIFLTGYTLVIDGRASSEYLQVHFLDVGQGDAIFIETPDGVQVLVDGGVGNGVLRVLSREMSFFDRDIDMVIGTHPDGDHIGGLVDVLERYRVHTILKTENVGKSVVWNTYTDASENEGAQILYARAGQVFTLGEEVFLKVLYPVYDVAGIESNASSIVLQVIYGDTKILLTGDSPKRIEEYLVKEGVDIESDVLKAGHHGSRTSTSEIFLKAVSPQYAVISAGVDNTYGHPHVEVTDLLFNYGVNILNTAQKGTVTFESDGEKIWRKMD